MGRQNPVGEFADNLDHVTSPGLRTAMRHWRDCLEHGRSLPSKDRIDPLVLGPAGLLPYVWIIEVPPDAPPFFRLAGEGVARGHGHSVVRRTIYEVFERQPAETIERRWRCLLADDLFGHTQGDIYSDTGRVYSGDRIALPLADEAGSPRFIFGCTDYSMPNEFHTSDTLKTYKERFSILTPISCLREMT